MVNPPNYRIEQGFKEAGVAEAKKARKVLKGKGEGLFGRLVTG